MNILTENEINIKSLEKYFYDCGCKLAAEAFANYLEALDQEFMKSRDKGLLRHKGHRKTCIKTLMGEVEYSRAVYQVMDNECEKKFVYLLDEYVGFENIGFSQQILLNVLRIISAKPLTDRLQKIYLLLQDKVSVIKVYGMLFKSSVLRLKQGKTDILSLTRSTSFRVRKKLQYCLKKLTVFLSKSKSDIGIKGATLLNLKSQ